MPSEQPVDLQAELNRARAAVRAAARVTRAVQADLVHAGTLSKSDKSPVTVADFAILQNHFNGPGGFKDGDFNNDGLVTFADFSILQNNFDGEGGTASVETLQAMAQALVPEPATLPLMAMILTAGAMRRKNRKRTEAR